MQKNANVRLQAFLCAFCWHCLDDGLLCSGFSFFLDLFFYFLKSLIVREERTRVQTYSEEENNKLSFLSSCCYYASLNGLDDSCSTSFVRRWKEETLVWLLYNHWEHFMKVVSKADSLRKMFVIWFKLKYFKVYFTILQTLNPYVTFHASDFNRWFHMWWQDHEKNLNQLTEQVQ